MSADGPSVPPPPRVIGEDATPHDHRKNLPPIPLGTGTLPQPNSPQSGGLAAGPVPTAPCDLRFFQNSVVKPTGASTSLVGEPSVAQLRDTVLQTGNWYAARSIDSGETWTHISPYTTFPATDGGFCCDQRAIYIPSADITVWLLQYSYSSTTQKAGQRIAIANGRVDLQAGANGSWHSYYLSPQNFGRGLGEWMDFPDIAYSNGFLYVASNMFNASSSFTDAVVWRMPLTELAAGGSVSYSYSRSTTGLSGGASYRLTQNATGTMYFAEHRSTTVTRAYRWPDASGTISWTDITVPDWSSTTGYVASAPNGVNWAGRADSRITGAYYKSGEYGFMWHCGPRSGRAQVYVRTIRINSGTNALIATEDTWSSTLQFMYPAAAVNNLGDIGCALAVGDAATVHPTTCYMIVDSCLPNFHGQSVSWFSGNASPTTASRWGDYFSLQRHSHLPATFVATGMTCRDGGANGNSEPHYIWFGRESNQPTYVNLAVSSTPVTGIPITIDVTDRNGLKNGNTNFNRVYSPRQGYELTAPLTFVSGANTYRFDRWLTNGIGQPVDQRVLVVDDIGVADDTAEAQYKLERLLQVRSTNPASGVPITVSLADLSGAQNGSTSFDRTYKDGVALTLTAPASVSGVPFKRWVLNGVNQPLGVTTLNVAMTATRTANAVYYVRTVGSFATFGTSCAGTTGLSSHTGVAPKGYPFSGDTWTLRLTNARPNTGAALYVGVSNTTWNAFPLPLNLGFIGINNCFLRVSVDINIATTTNASGVGQLTFPTPPNDPGLIGASLYSQWAYIDIGAPYNLPLPHSNGLRSTFGGDL
ncbi:MAG: hypothetical protein IT458_02740 [Planctomycetes bacterium]|nr:hypothetical protein [Planctomycetota bacterium]